MTPKTIQGLIGVALLIGASVIAWALVSSANAPPRAEAPIEPIAPIAHPEVQPLTAEIDVEKKLNAQKQLARESAVKQNEMQSALAAQQRENFAAQADARISMENAYAQSAKASQALASADNHNTNIKTYDNHSDVNYDDVNAQSYTPPTYTPVPATPAMPIATLPSADELPAVVASVGADVGIDTSNTALNTSPSANTASPNIDAKNVQNDNDAEKSAKLREQKRLEQEKQRQVRKEREQKRLERERKELQAVELQRKEKQRKESIKEDTDTHTVSRGDNLIVLSRRYGVPVSAIMEANNLQDKDHLPRGRTIKIPSKAEAQALMRKAEMENAKKAQKREAKQELAQIRKNAESDKRNYGVQVSMAENQAKANALAAKYRSAGYKVTTSQTSRGVRVIVGQEKSKEAALALKKVLKADDVPAQGAWVLAIP